MTIKVTIMSTKGGVGKTTLSANLGGILADMGQRVLLVDADVQPTLSSYFSLHSRAKSGLTALAMGTFDSPPDIISTTSITSKLDIVISDDPVGKLRDWILHTPDGRVRLKYSLAKLDSLYDFVLIDTQGAIGPLQDAAVLAADMLLTPVPPEILSAREFTRGTIEMLERLRPMAYLGAPVGPLKAIIYRQGRTRDSRSINRELRSLIHEFKSASFVASRGTISVANTVVPNAAAYLEAATAQMPVHRHERRRSTGVSARDVMISLVWEIFPHLADVGPTHQAEINATDE